MNIWEDTVLRIMSDHVRQVNSCLVEALEHGIRRERISLHPIEANGKISTIIKVDGIDYFECFVEKTGWNKYESVRIRFKKLTDVKK